MNRYLLILSTFIFLRILSSTALAMESSLFEDPEYMKSPFRTSALQPRTKPFERLEFLGDRVLGLVAAHMLYKDSSLKDRDIGDIATSYAFIVSKYRLIDMYNDLHIDSSNLSSSDYCAPVNGYIAEKTASDIVEALMGALYLERGFEKAQEPLEKFIEKYWTFKNEKPIEKIQKAPLSAMSLIRMYFPSTKNFTPLEEALEYPFKNVSLLHDAFHHPSMGGEIYKKLGFLGVRVLGLVLADYVFNKEQEDVAGVLSQNFDRMISNNNLEKIFQNWRLGKYLERQHETLKTLRKKGARGTGISTGMAADTIRTLVSAVFLDGGWKSAHSVVHKLFFSDPPPQFLDASCPYATIKAEVKKEDFFTESCDEIKEEDFEGFSDEECLKLPEQLVLEKYINPNNQTVQWPSLKTNEQTASKKESIWGNINNSSVKLSNDQSKTQPLGGKIESKTHTPQREVWPSLATSDQLTESKDSIWKNMNGSAVKKPQVQATNTPSSNLLPINNNEQKATAPHQEIWPSLSHSTQTIEKK